MPLTYQEAGVDYGPLDAFKRACQREAAGTVAALAQHGLSQPPDVRGESAYLVEAEDEYLAHVEEGLGTKNLVADAMLELTGKSYYENIGIDTVVTIVNDLVTSGALPLSVAMHAAVGDAAWFAQGTRGADLARGFGEGCRRSGAVWGGGETPALRGIVDAKTIVLAGSAIGRIRPKSNRIAGQLADGDVIVLLGSRGVHTNGLTLCRELAGRLPDGFLTRIDDGRSLGEALLDASEIYVPFVAECQRRGVRIKYAVHITGHGWRKLMRLPEPFVYRISALPEVPAVLRFIQKTGPVEQSEAYGTFNMGAGFAAYVGPGDAGACLSAAKAVGLAAMVGGTILKQGNRKAVEILPLGITYEADSLQVR
ncbi:MAG: AIR synthase related protein [Tepidisphaeraceae bacterium]|jgi:phosphoribosylformylglycinamidine cyclo-ligase